MRDFLVMVSLARTSMSALMALQNAIRMPIVLVFLQGLQQVPTLVNVNRITVVMERLALPSIIVQLTTMRMANVLLPQPVLQTTLVFLVPANQASLVTERLAMISMSVRPTHVTPLPPARTRLVLTSALVKRVTLVMV